MSDVSIAPPSGGGAPVPASTPSPAPANEVAINQNPVDVPNPVTNAPPDRATARRNDIRAAFDRATEQQDKGEARKPTPKPEREAPKAAEAKAGHNQPPEQTPPERVPDRSRASQPREQGRFAARQPDGDGVAMGHSNTADAKGTDGTQSQGSVRTLPEGSPYRDPPPRFAPHAQAEWHAAPESVRGEVHRMQQEFGRAYQSVKADAEAMQPLKQYHELARSQGTDLPTALRNYVSIEQKLRADPVGGLDVIVQNLGLKGPNGEPLGLRDIAYHVLSSTPEQLRQMQMGNQQSAASQQIGALHQEIQGLKQALGQMHTQQQFAQIRGQVDQYADQHPRFDKLGDIVEQELRAGWSLDEAYRRAELLRPATQEAQTLTPSAQTRQPNRSISGSPDSNSSLNGHARKGPPPSRREAIESSIRAVLGGS